VRSGCPPLVIYTDTPCPTPVPSASKGHRSPRGTWPVGATRHPCTQRAIQQTCVGHSSRAITIRLHAHRLLSPSPHTPVLLARSFTHAHAHTRPKHKDVPTQRFGTETLGPITRASRWNTARHIHDPEDRDHRCAHGYTSQGSRGGPFTGMDSPA
jgi:hypothetical protein